MFKPWHALLLTQGYNQDFLGIKIESAHAKYVHVEVNLELIIGFFTSCYLLLNLL